MVPRRGPAGALRALAELAGVVVPVSCAGCGRYDVALCDPCRELWGGPGARVEHGAGRLDRLDGSPPPPVWAVVPYVGVVRSVVVAWKDRGRVDLHPVLREAIAREATRRLSALGRLPGVTRLVVVPVPSSPGAVRRRGRDLVRDLATEVAAGLGADPAPVLRVRGRKRDQVGLGARERARNLRGAIRLRARARRFPPGLVAVLVDDVVTSGATLVACEDVLRGAGVPVVAAFCLAATPAPGAAHSAFPGAAG